MNVFVFSHRALDISRNCFTLDSKLQCDTFLLALSPLVNLEALSVAYNKIQDAGLKELYRIIRKFLRKLKILDVAGCFLSKGSHDTLIDILEIKDPFVEDLDTPQLDELIACDNILSYAVIDDLHKKYGIDFKTKLNLKDSYTGIDFPLLYDFKDYGVDYYGL